MSLYDRYQVEIDHQKKDNISKAVVNRLGESNVLLVGEDNELCGIFNLVGDGKSPQKFYLCKGRDIGLQMKNHRHYSLLYFEKKESDYLYNAYYDIKQQNISVLHYYKIPLVDIEVHSAEETGAILSIDLLSALIIDCSGGTTDLSSCSFSIHNDAVAYDVAIRTTYENGDTNFGGNNITYRIMQYIKIMFASYYTTQKTVKINDLITVPTEDVFRYVDEFGKEKVYENLEREYDLAEQIIPTKFKQYENRTREEYFMVKNNFYFLFDIADQMKKQFYMSDSIIRNRFQSNYEEEDEDLKIIRIER